MMKLYEYRTNGERVMWRETASTVVLWRDAVSTGVAMSMGGKAAGILTEGWRTMTPAEVGVWCFSAKAIPAGIPGDDWQGMYNVAAKRAQEAEDALAAVRKAVQASEVKPLPPGTYYTEHVEHATKISEARRLALVEIRSILGMEVGK